MMALEDKIVWGGLYRVKHKRWDGQVYRQAVPVKRKDGSIWMQDTYQLDYCGRKSQDIIDTICSLNDPDKGDWAIRNSSFTYYHTGNEVLADSGNNLDDYELICDLHEYRPLNRVTEDSRHYNYEDLIYNVHLAHEHGYSWTYGDCGITLVKRGAQPQTYRQWLAALQDVSKHQRRPSKAWNEDELLKLYHKCIEEGIRIHPNDATRFKNTLYINQRLREMEREINDYLRENRYKPSFEYEDEILVPLGLVHEDMPRYLEEDCYCPNEIYDIGGSYYEIFSPEHMCKGIYEDDTSIIVISRMADYVLPEILYFDISEEGKIISAFRFDITPNNLKLIQSGALKDIEAEVKIDEYTGREFPEEIDALIKELCKIGTQLR
jgi:hypothetical protein